MRHFILWTEQQKFYAKRAVDGLMPDRDAPMEITIKPWEEPKTLEQNKGYWVLVDVMANAIGYDKEEMHETLLGEHFGWREIEKDGKVIMRMPKKRSSEVGKRLMAKYIDWLYRFAAEQDIILPELEK